MWEYKKWQFKLFKRSSHSLFYKNADVLCIIINNYSIIQVIAILAVIFTNIIKLVT